jgi:interleukin-1 receptor-associated kinase 1
MMDLVKPYEASFSVTITLSAYRTQANNSSRLIFAVLPRVPYGENGSMSLPLNGSLTNSIHTSKNIGGSHVSVQIGGSKSNRMRHTESRFIWVEISIEQVDDSAADNYTVWIDYNRTRQHISVYVDVETVKPKLTSPVADIPLLMSDTMGQVGFFGLSSSMGQLLQLHTWSSTVEQLQLPLPCCPGTGGGEPPGGFPTINSRSSPTAILSLVLVSAAVTAIMISIVYCYFNSKYRRWKKDLDKLAKSIQRLPGMPVQVKFIDIRNATNNFHETTVLGRGTYGVVYKCRLPTLKNGGVMLEVAVKMFMRDDSRRYEDFLTEVSVISRLRHKNIVSLVGK